MTIKIEFESVYDLEHLMGRTAAAEAREQAAADRAYSAEERARQLQIKLDEAVRPAPVPIPHEVLRDLMQATKDPAVNKITMIKCVRQILGLCLKDAKDFTDAIFPPHKY